jgi:hypothetical protein
MITSDPRIRQEQLHAQMMFIPSLDAWRDIINDGNLDNIVLLTHQREIITGWLDEYSSVSTAYLGLFPARNRWWLFPLIYINQKYFRVHFENVICEHCNKPCGVSATPDFSAYAGSGLNHSEVLAEFAVFPRLHCPHCGGVLWRRSTIWLDIAQKI